MLKGSLKHNLSTWKEGVEQDAPYTFVIRIFANKNTIKTIGKVNLSLSEWRCLVVRRVAFICGSVVQLVVFSL